MTRFLFILALFAIPTLWAAAAPASKTEPVQFISLTGKTNVKLDENLHSDTYPNNNLKTLPAGKQKLGDLTFEIGEGILQLASSNVAEKPKKIEGIKVGRAAQKLHFLQGTGYKTADDTVIAKYIINYEDKSSTEIEVVYGKDVVDWWAYPDQKAPTKGKAVWEGENEASKGFEAKIKLYAMTWENPKPEKRIATIDFVAANPEQAAAPFCVAITASDK